MTPSAPAPAPPWLRVLAWTGVVLWAVTITVLSSLPGDRLKELSPFELWDKAAHFLAYAAGAVNLALALRWTTAWPWKRIIIFTSVALSGFGVIDEIHQLYTPHRSGADPFDWTADTLGAAAGALATCLIHARYPSTRRLTPAGD
ncbi:MAG: hypothetical protein QOE70_2223 [Chthoniobacter sp.]|nr:hypothetical protein [Chthoniobacter sp.]